jgi:hypothetical protein
MYNNLDLGWCQGYMGLQYHMEDALIEKNLDPSLASCRPPIAIFSKKYYNEINELNHEKKYDFCFIGSINSGVNNRKWIIEFAKKYFTHNSVFINTDNNPEWILLGSYDYSNKNLGFCPKEQKNNHSRDVQYRKIKDNIFYFETMCQSKYILCPAGDTSWSFRFYETLMCNSIPIVETWHHTYRTKEESNIKYKYILSSNYEEETKNINYDNYIKENDIIFKKYHMLT